MSAGRRPIAGASGAFEKVNDHDAEARSAATEQAGSADAADSFDADEEVETEAFF